MMIARVVILSVLVSLGAISIRAADQPTTDATSGGITGIVVDPQGNPVKDCVISAQQANEKMREPLQATSDDKGAFTIENAPEGEYNLNVRTRDLKGKAIKTLTVIAGKTANAGKVKLKMK